MSLLFLLLKAMCDLQTDRRGTASLGRSRDTAVFTGGRKFFGVNSCAVCGDPYHDFRTARCLRPVRMRYFKTRSMWFPIRPTFETSLQNSAKVREEAGVSGAKLCVRCCNWQ